MEFVEVLEHRVVMELLVGLEQLEDYKQEEREFVEVLEHKVDDSQVMELLVELEHREDDE